MSQIYRLTTGKEGKMNDVELACRSKEQRRETIVRLYFVMQYTLQEVAKEVGISKSQVGREVQAIKREILRFAKKDIGTNKKILGHMVGLMEQIKYQTCLAWEKYNQLEDDLNLLRTRIKEASESIRQNPDAKLSNLSESSTKRFNGSH